MIGCLLLLILIVYSPIYSYQFVSFHRFYHAKILDSSYHVKFDQNSPNKQVLYASRGTTGNAESTPIKSEFSRIVNVIQIPRRNGIKCRLLAKENEREKIDERFATAFNLTYFAANITALWKDETSILVKGNFEARFYYDIDPNDPLTTKDSFETLLLYRKAENEEENESNNTALSDDSEGDKEVVEEVDQRKKKKKRKKKAVEEPEEEFATVLSDYDDEIGADGDIDFGEIALQYFGLVCKYCKI